MAKDCDEAITLVNRERSRYFIHLRANVIFSTAVLIKRWRGYLRSDVVAQWDRAGNRLVVKDDE